MRITKCILKIFVFYIILTTFSLHGYALEKPTHFEINKYIAENNIGGFSLDQYLKEQLVFEEGIDKILEQFEGQKIDGRPPKIFNWLGYGGKKEDEPAYIRSCRHFHNPLESWDNAGLKGIWDSSIIWGQRTDQWPGGHYSWQDVRDYFYSALTSEDQTTRDYYFAETFRGLGQQMHLIEDASVPLHTRDDIHIIFNYEKWIEAFRTDRDHPENQETFNEWLADDSRYGYEKSVLSIAPNPLAPIPVARIIDTDKYNGDNPGVTIYESIGIAEYSNANFFTKDTKFGDFPSPNWDNVQCVDYEIQGPRDPSYTVKRPYYWKNINPPASDGDTGYRLATVGYLSDYVKRYFPMYIDLFRGWEKPALDANVYRDYAERLIPRAVGYSAGLLDYFFRGKLQVMSLPILSGSSITALRLKIKNITPSEEAMTNGHFVLVCRYTPTGGNPDGSDDIFLRAPDVNFDELQYGDQIDILFGLPEPKIPIENYDSVECILAFQGTLGNEAGAVIGKSFLPLIFIEEWDNDLIGNHPWVHHTGGHDPAKGIATNKVESEILIKDNIRFVGQDTACVNESYLEFADVDTNNPGLLITPNTYLHFKIDELSINEIPPAPPEETTNLQALMLHFNNGLWLQFSQEGQFMYWNPTTAYYTFPLGMTIIDNIYLLFQNAGIEIPEPLYLKSINFVQQLLPLEEPSTVEHHQHMEVDLIKIIKGYN